MGAGWCKSSLRRTCCCSASRLRRARRSGSARIPTRGWRASCWPTPPPAGPVRLEVNAAAVVGGTALRTPQVAEQAARGVATWPCGSPTSPGRRARRACCCCSTRRRTSTAARVCTAASLPLPVPAPAAAAAGDLLRRRRLHRRRDRLAAGARRRCRPADLAHRRRLFPDDWQDTYGIRSFFGL